MNARFTPPADADVRDIRAWYRGQGEDLAVEFWRALDECVGRIEANPLAYASVHGDMRRALLRRFPYSVFYTVELTEVVVHGVFHGSRNPEAWRSRYEA